MILRPRQKVFVKKCVSALKKHGNTLGVACVGFGKTYSMSIIIDNIMQKHGAKKTLVLQHRTKLKDQNKTKFEIATDNRYTTSFIQGVKKDFSSSVPFGMIQTVARNLDGLPKFDLLVVDETHRILGGQYLETIDKLKELNPDVKILGVTATPNRGDKKGLGKVFTNVADIVTIEETIRAGYLVPPRTYSLDMGQITKLMGVSKTSTGEYDQEEVADILNSIEITKGVLKYWKEIAKGRKTIAFCATVEYAKNIRAFFERNGIKTSLVYSGTGRDKINEKEVWNYEHGDVQIMFNVAVFTEGYDYPPTSCIMLLRQSSYHGTMVQMIGRGLRIVNEEEYPGVVKTDCVVLDFGISTTIHGTLESGVDLEDRFTETDEDLEDLEEKMCPSCLGVIPSNSKKCPLCGFEEEAKLRAVKEELKLPIDFNLIEVNLLDKFSFRYEKFENDQIWVASGFEASVFVVKGKGNLWNAFGRKDKKLVKIATSNRQICFSQANDWMNLNETDNGAKKNKRWLTLPPTNKQHEVLTKYERNYKGRGTSRYRASCMLSLLFSKSKMAKMI